MILIWSIFKRLLSLLNRLLFIALLVLVLGKVLAFGFSLYAESHRSTVEDWASQIIGAPIHIQHIQTDWSGFIPRLWLRGLSVGADEHLNLGDVRVSLNLGALPGWRHHLPIDLQLSGTLIQILRDRTGHTRIVGLPRSQGKGKLPHRIILNQASIHFRDLKQDAQIALRGLHIQLLSEPHFIRLEAHSTRNKLWLRGEIQGAITGHDWSGRFWLRGLQLQAENLLRPYLPPGYLLNNLRLDFMSWTHWENGALIANRTRLKLHDLALHLPNSSPINLSQGSVDLLYEPTPKGWTLQAKDLSIQINNYLWSHSDLVVSRHTSQLKLALNHLNLAGLQPLLPALPLPTGLQQTLQHMQPTGLLKDVRLTLEQNNDDTRLAQLSLRFAELSVAAWKDLPGWRNLRGDLHLSAGQAQLILDSQQVSLNLPKLFRQALPLDRLQGTLRLNWTTQDHWSLQSDRLIVDNSDLQTINRLFLQKKPGYPLFMDMQSDFRNGKVERAARYFPVGIMKPSLVEWLDQALISGRVSRGSFIYLGPVQTGKSKHFPFHQSHDGHFEVEFDVENAMIKYDPAWPPIEDLDARVRFFGNSLLVESRQGRIFNSRIRAAEAFIESLYPADKIWIKGRARGPLQDLLKFVEHSPLKKKLGTHLSKLQPSGRGDLTIDLGLPLNSLNRNPQFKGHLDLKKAQLNLPAQNLQLQQLSGRLDLSLESAEAKNLEAKLLGGKASINLLANRQGVQISAQADLPVTGLEQQFPTLKILGANGRSSFNLKIVIPDPANAKNAATVRIDSDLRGIRLPLPPPFTKTANEHSRLRYFHEFGNQTSKLLLQYGDALKATIDWNAQQGMNLNAQTGPLDLRAWLAWWNKKDHHLGSSFNLKHLRLHIQHLSAGPLSTNDFLLQMNFDRQHWSGSVESPNIKGRLDWWHENRHRMKIELKRLYLQAADASDPNVKIQPAAIPDLDLITHDLRINDARMGRLKLSTHLSRGIHHIDHFNLEGKLATLSLKGRWASHQADSKTAIKGRLTTQNAGHLLRKIWKADFLSGSKTYASFDLNWPGAPFHFNLRNITGTAELNMTQGRFHKINPGLARILGLLNFGALGRRLQGDFKDLYKEGLAFDTIIGNFRFENALLITDDLEIIGPSASLFITGTANLIEATYDALLTVSPRLDTTLPLAGALAGGPAAGVAVLVAQQVFSKQLQKMQSIQYTISGPWSEPVITRKPGPESLDTTEEVLP